MEYKLNKIDTDLRIKVNEMSKSGVVHTKKDITVNKDKNKNEDKNKEQKEFKLSNYNNKKIVVEAEMKNEVEVEGFYEEKELEPTLGRFLDSRE